MERLHTHCTSDSSAPYEHTSPLETRRRFLSEAVATLLTTAVGTLSLETLRPARQDLQVHNPHIQLQEVLSLIRQEFPDLKFCEQHQPEKYNNVPYDQSSVTDFCKRIVHYLQQTQSSPSETVEAIAKPVEYFENYRLSKASAKRTPIERLDCNDYCNWICEHLSEHGVPMYMLTFWHKENSDHFRDWHIIAFCKIQDEQYLFIDNGQVATLWHGSIGGFLEQHPLAKKGVSGLSVCPVGISRYVQPHHDWITSKYALQLLHCVSNPNDIRCIGNSQFMAQK